MRTHPEERPKPGEILHRQVEIIRRLDALLKERDALDKEREGNDALLARAFPDLKCGGSLNFFDEEAGAVVYVGKDALGLITVWTYEPPSLDDLTWPAEAAGLDLWLPVPPVPGYDSLADLIAGKRNDAEAHVAATPRPSLANVPFPAPSVVAAQLEKSERRMQERLNGKYPHHATEEVG